MTLSALVERPPAPPAAGYLCDQHGEPYDAETFDLDAYLASIPMLEEALCSSAGRVELTRDDPLLFACVYLPHLLKNADGETTFGDVHLGLYRDALAMREPAGVEGDRRAYVAPRESGKALALDTPVLTVDCGWIRHGDLAVGDRLFDETGQPCTVTSTSPVWRDRPCYRITFDDRTSIVADAAHEWPVTDRWRNRQDPVTETAVIAGKWKLPTTRSDRVETRYSLPTARPLQYSARPFPVDPYVLGVWLGDGHSDGGRVTVAHTEAAELAALLAAAGENPVTAIYPSTDRAATIALGKPRPERCPREHPLRAPLPRAHGRYRPCAACTSERYAWDKAGRVGPRPACTNRALSTRLRDLGVLGNKHIPEEYLRGSAEQRLALLQGLMDTDGTVSAKGRCEFTGMNRRLCEGVLQLARSIGIKARIADGRAPINGVDVGTKWRVTFTTALPVFRLSRKAGRIPAAITTAVTSHRIVGVERIEDQATSCIEVDSPSHLYLAGPGLVPTHNSTVLYLVTTLWVACHHPTFVAAFSDTGTQAEDHLKTVRAEMTKNRLVREDYPDACAPMPKENGHPIADSAAMMYTRNAFCFSARGIDTGVLGLVDPLNRRPQIILVDDIEGQEGSGYSIYQAGQRRETVISGILPMNGRAHVRMVGTVTLVDGLMHQLVNSVLTKDPPAEWIVEERIQVTYFPPLPCRPDGTERSVWPGRWPVEHLQGLRHTRSYAKNFENQPIGVDGGYWSEDDFTYGTLDTLTQRVLRIDPATTAKRTSDRTGIAVVAYSPVEQKCVVEFAEGVQLTGRRLGEHLRRLIARWPTVIHRLVVEVNQGGDLWHDVFDDLPIPIETRTTSVSKEVRFAKALDWYQKKPVRVLHAEKLIALEAEMTGFPRAPHDDVADAAVGGLEEFLTSGPRLRFI
jgi:LAGLIDADG-like domain